MTRSDLIYARAAHGRRRRNKASKGKEHSVILISEAQIYFTKTDKTIELTSRLLGVRGGQYGTDIHSKESTVRHAGRTKSLHIDETDDKTATKTECFCSYCAFVRISLFTVKCQSHLDYIQADYTVNSPYENLVPTGVPSR